jgi:hypothetical protein
MLRVFEITEFANRASDSWFPAVAAARVLPAIDMLEKEVPSPVAGMVDEGAVGPL